MRRLLAHDAQLVQENDWLVITPGRSARQGPVPGTGQRTGQRTGPGHGAIPRQRTGDEPMVTPVIETLTRKELEVLEHLAELLTTEEIASDMYVSVNTDPDARAQHPAQARGVPPQRRGTTGPRAAAAALVRAAHPAGMRPGPRRAGSIEPIPRGAFP